MIVEKEKMEEEKIIQILKDLTDMKDTILGIIGKIGGYNNETLELLRVWYEKESGHKLDIGVDALDIRKRAIGYLKARNIPYDEDNKVYGSNNENVNDVRKSDNYFRTNLTMTQQNSSKTR